MSEISPRKILLTAGGTGGHVFPALVVADILRSRGHVVEWLGTERGIEASIVPQASIPLHFITIEGLRGKGKVALLKAPWLLFKAITQAMIILRKVQPDLVLGFGGFVSGPGGLSAKLLKIPLVVHEQNAVAGTTNRILSKIAQRVLEAFPGSLPKALLVGNPVRSEIAALPDPKKRYGERKGRINLLILGGSLGALAINQLIPPAVAAINESERPQIWHQTGKAHLEQTTALYCHHQVDAKIEPFISDMTSAFAWADLVVSRAGALTVSEITAAGVAAILIPFPFAIDDHQTKNAQWLAQNDAAIVKSQDELTPELMNKLLCELSSNRERLCELACRARHLAHPESAHSVANICQEIVSG